MARLIYAMNTSLDGYISDRDGKFEWGAPTPELFAAINELERPFGTYRYGRHLYETRAVWDTAHLEAGGPAFTPGLLELEREFARCGGPRTRSCFPRSCRARRPAHAHRTGLRTQQDSPGCRGISTFPSSSSASAASATSFTCTIGGARRRALRRRQVLVDLPQPVVELARFELVLGAQVRDSHPVSTMWRSRMATFCSVVN
jgi:hypothetical protein